MAPKLFIRGGKRILAPGEDWIRAA